MAVIPNTGGGPSQDAQRRIADIDHQIDTNNAHFTEPTNDYDALRRTEADIDADIKRINTLADAGIIPRDQANQQIADLQLEKAKKDAAYGQLHTPSTDSYGQTQIANQLLEAEKAHIRATGN